MKRFNPADRAREKQEARDRDESMLVSGDVTAEQLTQRNGFFSALDPSKARIASRRQRFANASREPKANKRD